MEVACLEQLWPVLATPHWRKDRHGQPRYLYLIHPTQDDGSRKREYIGADPEARAAALARVKAWDELQAIRSEIREVDHHLAAITGHLARALHAATNGLDPLLVTCRTLYGRRSPHTLSPLRHSLFADSQGVGSYASRT